MGEPKRVVLAENQLVDWTPRAAVRMLWHGVRVGNRDLSRRFVARRLAQMFSAWMRWLLALPGDRYWNLQRDLIVEIAHGPASRRTVRILNGEVCARYGGLDRAAVLADPEPCPFAWYELRAL